MLAGYCVRSVSGAVTFSGDAQIRENLLPIHISDQTGGFESIASQVWHDGPTASDRFRKDVTKISFAVCFSKDRSSLYCRGQ